MIRVHSRKSSGFTIVELLVVIVVIGILAAITIVSYTGISKKAVASSLQSDLANASQQLKLYQVDNDAFPTALDCSATPAINTICLKSSSGNSYTYFPVNNTNPQTFSLTASSGSTTYRIASNSTPTSCPDNFIAVPSSATYGTSDFCVMKYEAKNVGGVATSQAAGTPWASITQTSAITTAAAACSGCHLITEVEWLTIAQNVLKYPANWSGGTVGSGYIYSGHNDNAPASSLAADTNDANGYFGETNTGGSQRRTLTLNNGEAIWDLAGNVMEFTNGTVAGGQQPGLSGESAYAWKQWNDGSLLQNGLLANAMPGYTGISGASGWSSTQGIGQLYSNYGQAATVAFSRGGYWNDSAINAGVFALRFNYLPSTANGAVGFRVSR